MSVSDIEALNRLLQQYRIAEFDYDDGVRQISIKPQIDAAPRQTPVARVPTVPVRAPYAGRFLARHPLDKEPAPGARRVVAGEIIGFLQVGPLLRPVTSPQHGTLGAPHFPDGHLTGYGTALFDLQPDIR